MRRSPPGQRFGWHPNRPNGGGIDEAKVRHYRFGLDDWGKLDVICFDMTIQRVPPNQCLHTDRAKHTLASKKIR
ncbi:MAG: hypothetical protein ACMUJM_20665 [bacterium]